MADSIDRFCESLNPESRICYRHKSEIELENFREEVKGCVCLGVGTGTDSEAVDCNPVIVDLVLGTVFGVGVG